jgi:tetratricopeptide (TPR) repeat protein
VFGLKKIILAVLLLLFCSFIVSASSKFVLKVEADSQQEALDDIRAHPFVLYFKLGVFYFHEGEFQNAIKAFTKAIKIKEDYAEAYHNIGVSYHELGELDLAIENFEKSVKVREDYAKGYYSLGLAYYENHEYQNAIEAIEEYVALETSPNAFFDLGIIYVARYRELEQNQEYLEKALYFYDKCLETDPEFPHAQVNRDIVEKVLEASQ